MFNPIAIGIGFAACALLCTAFPKVAVAVNAFAAKALKWGKGVWHSLRSTTA